MSALVATKLTCMEACLLQLCACPGEACEGHKKGATGRHGHMALTPCATLLASNGLVLLVMSDQMFLLM